MNVHTPGFMRAQPGTPYMFALESAMDELARARPSLQSYAS
jgi:CO/xanthine dehydrogenase Mo-binding subunit